MASQDNKIGLHVGSNVGTPVWDYLADLLRDAGKAIETAAKEKKQDTKHDAFSNGSIPLAPDNYFGPPSSFASWNLSKKIDVEIPELTPKQKTEMVLDVAIAHSKRGIDSFVQQSEEFIGDGKKSFNVLDPNRQKILRDDVAVIKSKVEGMIKKIEELKADGLEKNIVEILALTEELGKCQQRLAMADHMLGVTLPAMQELGWPTTFFEVSFSRLVHAMAGEIRGDSNALDLDGCIKDAGIVVSYVEKGIIFDQISDLIDAGSLKQDEAMKMLEACKGGAEGFCDALETSEHMDASRMGVPLSEFYTFEPEGKNARAVGSMAVGLGLAMNPFDGDLWDARKHIEDASATVSPWASENGADASADPFAIRDPRNNLKTACDEDGSGCTDEDASPFERLNAHVAWIEERFPTEDVDSIKRLKATMDRELKIQMFEDAIAEIADGAVIGGERVVPSTRQLRLCMTDEQFQTEMLKLQNDIALVTLAKGVEELEKATDEILLAPSDEPQSTAMTMACAGPQRSGCELGAQADTARRHKAQYRAELEGFKAKAAEARRLMEAGDVEGAKKAFAEVVNQKKFQKLVEKIQMDVEHTGRVKYTAKIGIIVAAAFVAGVAGAKVGSALLAAEAAPALIVVLKFAASTTAFFVTDKALNLAVLHELPIDLNKTAGENALALTEEFGKTAAMFLFLELGMVKYTKFVEGKLFGNAVERLALGGKFTAEEMAKVAEIQMTRAGVNSLPKELAEKILKEAELGVVGKVANFGGLFTTEYTLFTDWDYIVQTYDESKASGSLTLPDAERFFTAESMLERLKFLACLKLGNALASPITKPIMDKAVKDALARLGPRIEKLEAKNKAILDEMALSEASGEQNLTKTNEFLGRLRECAQERLDIEKSMDAIAPGSVDLTKTKEAVENLKRMETAIKPLETISRGEFASGEKSGLKKFLEAGKNNGSLTFTENADGSFTVKFKGAEDSVEVRPSGKSFSLGDFFLTCEKDAFASAKIWVMENAPAINNWLMENAPMLAIGIDILFGGGGASMRFDPSAPLDSYKVLDPTSANFGKFDVGIGGVVSASASSGKEKPQADLTKATDTIAGRMFAGIRDLFFQKRAPEPLAAELAADAVMPKESTEAAAKPETIPTAQDATARNTPVQASSSVETGLSERLWNVVLENAPTVNNWLMENAPMLAIGVDVLFNGGAASSFIPQGGSGAGAAKGGIRVLDLLATLGAVAAPLLAILDHLAWKIGDEQVSIDAGKFEERFEWKKEVANSAAAYSAKIEAYLDMMDLLSESDRSVSNLVGEARSYLELLKAIYMRHPDAEARKIITDVLKDLQGIVPEESLADYTERELQLIVRDLAQKLKAAIDSKEIAKAKKRDFLKIADAPPAPVAEKVTSAPPTEIVIHEGLKNDIERPSWGDYLEHMNKAIAEILKGRDANTREYVSGKIKPVKYKATFKIFEVRYLETGPGYRIYFGEENGKTHILVVGDKSTQDADIAQAAERGRRLGLGQKKGPENREK